MEYIKHPTIFLKGYIPKCNACELSDTYYRLLPPSESANDDGYDETQQSIGYDENAVIDGHPLLDSSIEKKRKDCFLLCSTCHGNLGEMNGDLAGFCIFFRVN